MAAGASGAVYRDRREVEKVAWFAAQFRLVWRSLGQKQPAICTAPGRDEVGRAAPINPTQIYSIMQNNLFKRF